MAEISFENTGQVVDDGTTDDATEYYEPTESDKELTSFVVSHTDEWREWRDQNYMDDWLKYERIFRGQWKEDDKTRQSERSRLISPATQQAVETRHAETMEAIFGQGEFFDIVDDINDQNGPIDIEKLKAQLIEDFKQDKIRKSFDHITLMAGIYGTGIGELVVGKEKQYVPMEMPMEDGQIAYGTTTNERTYVRLTPINPKNFIFDPNGSSIDECMGVAVEIEVSIHKIADRIARGEYLNVDISSMFETDELEPTQEAVAYKNQKVKLLKYYGLVPREYLNGDEEIEDPNEEGDESELEDYSDMVEAIIVIGNGGTLLKREESPYMMKDRPILSYQDDSVPGRLLGRGAVEKSFNMQMAIDGSMRAHMDSLALTVAPMMGMDATRLPRGAKYEVKPGKNFMVNGNPSEILFPFKFGATDNSAMETSKEFERMLLMATATIDSNGQVSQVSRDAGGIDMATATMIKKYKRTLANFQEDFLIPFINKAAWRYMQFAPDRYPSVDVTFIPTGTLGVIAREYEQKQLAFLIQTLGAQSPLTPILMQSLVKNSSLSNREQLLAQLQQMSQPNPEQQQLQQQAVALEGRVKEAEAALKEAQAEKARVEAALAPEEVKARMISALTNNLNENDEDKSFNQRIQMADLMLREKDIDSNERIAKMQLEAKRAEKQTEQTYLSSVG